MKKHKSIKSLLLSGLLLLACQAHCAVAGDIYVIANPNVELSASDLRDVYLGEKLIANGVKLVLADNSAAQPDFLSKVMALEAAKYALVWTKKGFRDGLQPPDIKTSDADVILFVKRTPGAIGYVSADAITMIATYHLKTIKKY